jgi:hypothetical protein
VSSVSKSEVGAICDFPFFCSIRGQNHPLLDFHPIFIAFQTALSFMVPAFTASDLFARVDSLPSHFDLTPFIPNAVPFSI